MAKATVWATYATADDAREAHDYILMQGDSGLEFEYDLRDERLGLTYEVGGDATPAGAAKTILVDLDESSSWAAPHVSITVEA